MSPTFDTNSFRGLFSSRTLLLCNAAVVSLLVGRLSKSRTKRTVCTVFACAFLAQLWDQGRAYGGFWMKLGGFAGLWGSYKILTLLAILCLANSSGLDSLHPGKFRPLFFFGATTHARFGPVKHSFRYPLLYFGFPLDFTGKVGSLFEVKEMPTEGKEAEQPKQMLHRGFTFFSVDPTKYLDPKLPFNKKLEPILAGEGYDLKDYPHGYLVTGPQFLGYSFNPINYYYLYNAKQELKMIVFEIQNTFGEKHIYLMHADDHNNPKTRKGYTFCGRLRKCFHISPFNHRSGNYEIQVKDPLNEDPAFSRLDTNMTVIDAQGAKSMVARLFSTYGSVDPVSSSWMNGMRIATIWGWRAFMTVPQTMFEAWKIYRKSAKVHTRPEVLHGSGMRKGTHLEVETQELWLEYLQAKVSAFPRPLSVTVHLPQWRPKAPVKAVTFESSSFGLSEKKEGSTINIRVANSRFFRRFFSLQDPLQALYTDIAVKAPENQTAEIDDIRLLAEVFGGAISDMPSTVPRRGWRWRTISRLRHRTASRDVSAVNCSGNEGIARPSVHAVGFASAFDEFFLAGHRMSRRYIRSSFEAALVDTVGEGDSDWFDLLNKILGISLLSTSIITGVTLAAKYNVAQGTGYLALSNLPALLAVNSYGIFRLIKASF
ncbi:hypothetical protein BJ508DRAFT_324989 [Ascobolus immersus RN42]|uniref:DUF1365-domain-containing protein n=1 Tax=Ascobolus immersus RN42 TaxID=1160509 RepID=A0A3N4I9S6_ASCIM|nr:hypothetical protein BJ508DRAFT_324989 [Ascobolus immersus RN42]